MEVLEADEVDVAAVEEEEELAMEGRVVERTEAVILVENQIVSLVRGLTEGACVLLGRDIGKDPRLFMRTMHLLNLIHTLLHENRQVSQRDVYYQLISVFQSARECNAEIVFICQALRVSRISLGIYAASRGFVVGALKMLDDTGLWINLAALGRDGRTINGNMSDLRRPISAPTARYILVVEKEGVYQELSDAKLYNQIPCILVTAHGIPDVATRAFVSRLSRELNIPALCLADWNPGGVQVMISYRWGSLRATGGLAEGRNFQVLDFGWLGMLSEDVQEYVGSEHKLALSERDFQRLNNLKTSSERIRENALISLQLETMEEMGVRAELQSLRASNGVRSITDFVMRKLIRRQWIKV